MWTVENRGGRSYDRGGLRYPSDVTDDEWAHIAPLIPPAKRGGRKRNVDVRDVVNGLMYILSTGCQWRAIPKDLPPRSTLFGYFELWDYDGTLDRIHHSHAARCSAILSFGTMTERYTSNVVKRSGARPVPRPALSTLRV